MLYTAGMGLERGRQPGQQGGLGSILGPVTLGWWVCWRGSCPGLPGPRSCACWQRHLGSAHVVQGLVGHEASSGGCWVTWGPMWAPQESLGPSPRPAPHRLTLRANSGRTKAARCMSEL